MRERERDEMRERERFLPESSPPIEMSKNTLGFGPVCVTTF